MYIEIEPALIGTMLLRQDFVITFSSYWEMGDPSKTSAGSKFSDFEPQLSVESNASTFWLKRARVFWQELGFKEKHHF